MTLLAPRRGLAFDQVGMDCWGSTGGVNLLARVASAPSHKVGSREEATWVYTRDLWAIGIWVPRALLCASQGETAALGVGSNYIDQSEPSVATKLADGERRCR